MTGQIPPKPVPPPMPPKPWYPGMSPEPSPAPPSRPKYRQRVILQEGARPFKTALDEAIQNGWTIEQVTVNGETNCWIAIIGKV